MNRLRELVEINRAIASSLDYDRVLRLVVEKTAEFTRADGCALLLADAQNHVRVVASTGIDESRARRFFAPLDERMNLALQELVRFDDADMFLGVPVIYHGQIRGVLAVYRRASRRPEVGTEAESYEEFLVTALADQAAIALEHATRYRDVHELSEHKSRLLETIQSNTTSHLAYLDRNLRFVEANAPYCQIVGHSRQALLGKHFADVSRTHALLRLLDDVVTTGEAAELKDVGLAQADSDASLREVYWDCSARPVFGARHDVTGVVLSAVDVSDRVRARKELEAEGHRKDEFLAMLAHELRNPLGAIVGAVQVLRLKLPDDPALVRVLDAASRQGTHMKRLLDDLLDVSRITRGKITLERVRVDVSQVIDQALESTAALIQSGQHDLSVSLPQAPITVNADPERLVQIVSNLLSNAAKFTPRGGRIWLTVEGFEDELEIRVRDAGSGIDPKVLPFVFDLFVQSERPLDRTQGGLGIGLTLVKRLVELHEGTVEVRSEGIGRGSEFSVRLPIATNQRLHQEPEPQNAPLPATEQSVVLVEDNVDLADMLAAVLEMAHRKVVVVHDGLRAVEVIKEQLPSAVLLDIGLPGLNGYEVAERLREELGSELPVMIALSGYGQSADRERAKRAGISHHLVKPVDRQQLLTLLDRLAV